MAITDLSGTKWTINSLTCSAGYGDFFIGDGLIVNGTNLHDYAENIMIGYDWDSENAEPVAKANNVLLWTVLQDLKVGDTIEFPTGNGAAGLTNTNLISWLEANATQVKDAVVQIKPFLKGIADAIRNKKGTTETINAQNFASEIESIETGGGFVGYSGNINVYDGEFGATILVVHTDLTIEEFDSGKYPTQNISVSDVYFIIYCHGFYDIDAYYYNLVLTNLEIISENNSLESILRNFVLKPTANDFVFQMDYTGDN